MSTLSKLRKKLKRWSDGVYIERPQYPGIIVIPPGYMKRPWIVDVTLRVKSFTRRNWMVILATIGTVATVVSTVAAIIPLLR